MSYHGNQQKYTTEHYCRNEDDIVLYKVESSKWFQNGILKKSFRCYCKDKSEDGFQILKTAVKA